MGQVSVAGGIISILGNEGRQGGLVHKVLGRVQFEKRLARWAGDRPQAAVYKSKQRHWKILSRDLIWYD